MIEDVQNCSFSQKVHRLHIVVSKIVLDIVQSAQSLSFIHQLYNLVLLCVIAGSINVVSLESGQSARRAVRFSRLWFFILCSSSFPGLSSLMFRVIVYKLED